MYKKLGKGKVILLAIVIIMTCISIGVFKYLTFSMPADEEAIAAMKTIEEVIIEESEDKITFMPTGSPPITGLIYYPGGQVEPESFAYAAREIAKEGYLVVIQKMPFNLAIFGKDKAYEVTKAYDMIQNWYLSGFSLGGVSACMSLSEETEPFKGLILYASYTTQSYDLSDTDLEVLCLSGDNDGLSTPEKIEAGKAYLPTDTIYKEIPGGNHTQFAIYGDNNLQKGDGVAGISRMAQQDLIVSETLDFLEQQ